MRLCSGIRSWLMGGIFDRRGVNRGCLRCRCVLWGLKGKSNNEGVVGLNCGYLVVNKYSI
jgi:hypothetical protein